MENTQGPHKESTRLKGRLKVLSLVNEGKTLQSCLAPSEQLNLFVVVFLVNISILVEQT